MITILALIGIAIICLVFAFVAYKTRPQANPTYIGGEDERGCTEKL